MKIVFVTTDRVSPWNGTGQNEPDHIWADLPNLLNSPLLVCTTANRVRSDFEYTFGHVHFTNNQRLDTARAFLLFLTARLQSRTLRNSFLLGVTWRRLLSRVKRALLRQRSSSKDVLIWHKSVVLLTRALRTLKPDVVIFHNEFSPWGSAVVWAGKRVGIPTVAHQHYAVNNDPKVSPYNVERWRGLFPDGLLCITEDQVSRWGSLPIPIALGGSRRGLWSVGSIGNHQKSHEGSVLFAPALGDSDELEETIRSFPELDFHVKPHPSSKCTWDSANVKVYSGDFASIAISFEIVVTSSPSPIIALTALGKKYIHVTSYSRVGTCQCSERFSFECYRDVLDAMARGTSLTDLASEGCCHNLPPTPSKEDYQASILSILKKA